MCSGSRVSWIVSIFGTQGSCLGPHDVFINGSLVSSGPAWKNSVLEGHFHALVASLQCWVRPRAQEVYPSEPSLQAEGLPSPAVCGTLFSLCTACPAEAVRRLWLLPRTLSSSPRSVHMFLPGFYAHGSITCNYVSIPCLPSHTTKHQGYSWGQNRRGPVLRSIYFNREMYT